MTPPTSAPRRARSRRSLHPAVEAGEPLGGVVALRADRHERDLVADALDAGAGTVIRCVASAAPGASEARACRVRVSESRRRQASGRLTASDPLEGSDRCSAVLESSRPWMRVERRSASWGPTRPPSKVVSSSVSRSLTAFQKVRATVRSVVIADCSGGVRRSTARSTSPRSARRWVTQRRRASR